MSLRTKLTLSLITRLTGQADLSDPEALTDLRHVVALAPGTGAGAADRVFTDTRTLAASGSESLDLSGSLEDVLGGPAVFARVKMLAIRAHADNVNNVVIGGVASNGWITPFGDATDKIVLRPAAGLALWAGEEDATAYAVTAGTGDLLQVANSGSGTAVAYDIYIIGASA
ncbi:hypothetical protein [Herbidospora mongoliensis]|uniref:hypothetical protein n=1 Tax=Herbidospora mongoliensis TaxID=688067 RepID=UPI0008325B6A|nr:hypothetical protein [Herbidospora mongoliensis]